MTAQNPMRGDVAALVPAAGLGVRLGPGAPKALREIGGVTLLGHAVRRLSQAPSVGCIVVAAPADRVDQLAAELRTEVPAGIDLAVVAGGATRQASVAAALRAVGPRFAYVLVHDAARAFAPPELFERVAAALRAGHPAVIPVLEVVDTVKQVDASGHVRATLDRSALRTVQTPQGFRREVLLDAHARAGAPDTGAEQARAEEVTDDAGLVERLGTPVFCVSGAPEALKITRPADLDLAELLLRP